MFRISKLADYAIVVLTYVAHPADTDRTARDLADEAALPLPTVSKVLKMLCRSGLLVSRRGVRGGYTLARGPNEISIADVIGAIDGPIALTDCSTDSPGQCDLEKKCPMRANWRKINDAVRGALEQLKLSDLITFNSCRANDQHSLWPELTRLGREFLENHGIS